MAQNGVVKVGERLLPTIRSNTGEGSRAMALALAFILRSHPPETHKQGSQPQSFGFGGLITSEAKP